MRKIPRAALGALVAAFAARPALAAGSAVTHMAIAGQESVGTFRGVPFVRTWGTMTGVVAPNEPVEGLAALPKNAAGDYVYTSPFELIAPRDAPSAGTILIEPENRGSPLVLDNLNQMSAHGEPAQIHYPAGLGNGFLEDHDIAYGRIAWQAGISPGVPKTAQGVGEVIMRDFARLLAGETPDTAAATLGRYQTRLVVGISQSAWFIDTFIAEGFNADPGHGGPVYNGAIAVDGTGNWLALNRLAARAGATEAPYFAPDPVPLSAAELLHGGRAIRSSSTSRTTRISTECTRA